jgi:hypothetical protein
MIMDNDQRILLMLNFLFVRIILLKFVFLSKKFQRKFYFKNFLVFFTLLKYPKKFNGRPRPGLGHMSTLTNE